MQVGGSAHFRVRLGVRMSGIREREEDSSMHCSVCVFVYMCVLFNFSPDVGIVSFLSQRGYFMFFTTLSPSVFHTFPCLECLPQRCYQHC